MLESLRLDWSYLKIAVDRLSSIDLPRLYLRSKQEAKSFLFSYGYNWDDPIVREELWRIYFQSIAFIREKLLDEEQKEAIPDYYLQRNSSTEVIRLLLDASGHSESGAIDPGRAKWACAILRVMHVISHLDNDVKLENFNFAREQIFERFDRVVKRIEPRRWSVGQGERQVIVRRYLKKLRKDRNSILIKLLAKPYVMAEDIYDRLGVRFVVENRLDALRLLQALWDEGAISPVNINASRGVNSLMRLSAVEELIEEKKDALEQGKISLEQLRKDLKRIESDDLAPADPGRNPYSSPWYKALQITCRQLIVAPDPAYRFFQDFKQKIDSDPEAAQILQKIPISLREQRTFYYPFEIQILDIGSYLDSIGGRSRHKDYKARQRLTARHRVLRDLV